MLNRSAEIWIATVCLGLAVIGLVAWVPFDSETPPIYEFRRQTYIGDAMLPMVALAGIALCAAVHLLMSLRRRPEALSKPPFDALTPVFFARFFAIVGTALVLLYWAGPVALALFGPGSEGDAPVTYRVMRATVPWTYIGFVLGGFTMIFGLITLLEGRASLRRAIVALAAVAVLILVFDVPFDTILLPPNGDF